MTQKIELHDRDSDPMIVRLIKQRLSKGEDVFRRLRVGIDRTKPAWMWSLNWSAAKQKTHIVFLTTDGKHSNWADIGDDDDDKWVLIKNTRRGQSASWLLKRKDMDEPVTESIDDRPMLYDLLRTRLKNGEPITIDVTVPKKMLPTQAKVVGSPATYPVKGHLETIDLRTAHGRPTMVFSYQDDESKEFDSLYVYADMVDDTFDLKKVGTNYEDKTIWEIVNAAK